MLYTTYEAMNAMVEKQSCILLLTAGGIGIWKNAQVVFEGLKPMKLFALSTSSVNESESSDINEGCWSEGAILCLYGSRRYFAVGDTEADPGD